MSTLIIFLLTLGILIFVHELGHFLVARRNGIKVEEFGFGFPPRIAGFVKDEEKKKLKLVLGNRQIDSKNTIYSVNLIPLGGFVRIKGEDGNSKEEKDSFAGKPAWVRTKVLLAGVAMNFVLAWLVIALAFVVGAPEPVENGVKNSVNAKINISQVMPRSPAEYMGLKIGDEIFRCFGADPVCSGKFKDVASLQEFISKNKGKEISFEVRRGKEVLRMEGVPRVDFPKDQGALGIMLVQTTIKKYSAPEALAKSAVVTVKIIGEIFRTIGGLISSGLQGEKTQVDISGPVGIAFMAKHVTDLGFVYVLQFIAVLSINLGIINALPFPALDGGRVFFILIEKIKRGPLNRRMENIANTIGFFLLIFLMIVVTFHDFARFDLLGKIKDIF